MIGFDFLLGWIMFHIVLTDLFDERYNIESSFVVIPNFTISWSGKGKGRIISLIFSWLNLELSIMILDFDHYCDKLEEVIDLMEKNEEKDKD